jgi:hypothetical protein
MAGENKTTRPKLSQTELDRIDQELAAARLRLGSPKNTLQWFLEFKDMDLKALSPTERELIGYTLLAANEISRDAFVTEYSAKLMDAEIMHGVQAEIKAALWCLFKRTGKYEASYAAKGRFGVFLHRLSPVDAKEGRFRISFRQVDKSDIAIMGFVKTVQQAGKDLRTCARCKTPFVATKRQEYCSTKCSQIVRNEKKKMKAKKK